MAGHLGTRFYAGAVTEPPHFGVLLGRLPAYRWKERHKVV